MREIKFRGWHTTANKMFTAEEMASDQLTILPTGLFINVSGADTRLSEIYPKDKFTPLQYTGLKDKNGKEIYEGDVLNGCDFNGSYAYGKVIFWTSGWYAEPIVNIEGMCDFYNCLLHIEVIGNIYENPELLN